MNLSPESQASPTLEKGLEAQYRRMRMLLHATSVSVLILTATLFVFLYRQVVLVRRQTAEYARYLAEVERSGMQDFAEQVRAKLNDFRKDHPDFNPIYFRYFGTNEPPMREKVTALPTTTPAGGSTNQVQKAP